MDGHENYNVSPENQEEIRGLIREFHIARYGEPPSEERIDRTLAVWTIFGAEADNTSVLEFAKSEVALANLEKAIDDESQTCEERRQRIENEVGLTAEDQGTLDIAMDDLEWLEAKTGCRVEDVHRLSDEHELLLGQNYTKIDDENVKSVLGESAKKLESAISKASKRLRLVLKHQQKQVVKSSANVLVKQTQPCARAASRARRSTSRPTATRGGGGPGDSGDDSGDSDQGDPPGPPHSVTPLFTPLKRPNSTHHPWNAHGSWRMEGRRAA